MYKLINEINKNDIKKRQNIQYILCIKYFYIIPARNLKIHIFNHFIQNCLYEKQKYQRWILNLKVFIVNLLK